MPLPPISIEFFPPKTPAGTRKLHKVREQLNVFEPEYFSVTYGAGGSTRSGTRQTVLDIRAAGCAVAPHLSFGTDEPEVIGELIDTYRDAGIDRVVALRGDAPSGVGGSGQLRYAKELVEFIRERTGNHFHIEVAAYPEIHPESRSVEADIHYFKEKVEAGADRAITQYFYNADAYFRYLDLCSRAGITVDIVPGIMPITNYVNLKRFSAGCGAEIPRWLDRQLESFGDDTETLFAFGIEVITTLCERLIAGGAPGIHFYALNQSDPTRQIIRNLS